MYRCYREQLGAYWTVRRLERLQWEYLYALVTMDSKYGSKTGHIWMRRQRVLLTVRAMLCRSMEVAEELIPLKIFDDFFRKHEEYARLPRKYPEACILKDTLPIDLINAYRRTFVVGEVLPGVASKMLEPKEYRGSWRAFQVAEEFAYIDVPRACGDAALVAAYAMHKCRELYSLQCMAAS